MQIESFEMQLYVLRQLLETEKARVAATNDEIHKALTDLQDCKDEKSNVIKVFQIFFLPNPKL